MSIYLVQVPHRMPPKVWVASDEKEMISLVDAAASRSEAEINSFEDAVDWLRSDAHACAVYMSDAEALAALETGEGLPEHQRFRAQGALRDTLRRQGALPPKDEGEE